MSGYGTWLGLSKHGNFAFLTNFREELKDMSPNAISRGILVRDFLLVKNPSTMPISGDMSFSEAYIRTVAKKGPKFNGFNLVVGSVLDGEVWYVSNRGPEGIRNVPFKLEEGRAYGLSNATLFTGHHWPKVKRGTKGFWEVLRGPRRAAAKIYADEQKELQQQTWKDLERKEKKKNKKGSKSIKGCIWPGPLQPHIPNTCPITASLTSSSLGKVQAKPNQLPKGLFEESSESNNAAASNLLQDATNSLAQQFMKKEEAMLSSLTEPSSSDSESNIPTSSTASDTNINTLIENLLDVLRDKTGAPDTDLPMAVSNLKFEQKLAPICIEKWLLNGGWYGTRTHSVIVVETVPKNHPDDNKVVENRNGNKSNGGKVHYQNGDGDESREGEQYREVEVRAKFVEVDRYVTLKTSDDDKDSLTATTINTTAPTKTSDPVNSSDSISMTTKSSQNETHETEKYDGGIASRIKRRNTERLQQIEEAKMLKRIKQEKEEKERKLAKAGGVEFELKETRREFEFLIERS
jgi:uncharacterized protein with NRDE domain